MRARPIVFAMAVFLLGASEVKAPPVPPELIWSESTMRYRESLEWSTRYHISPELAGLILTTARRYDLPLVTAFNLVHRESRFNVDARGGLGEYGLTQLLPSTAEMMRPGSTEDELMTPSINLDLGFQHLRDKLERYDNVYLALTAYNGGHRRAARTELPTAYADLVMQGL